jgi:hypothetical protein
MPDYHSGILLVRLIYHFHQAPGPTQPSALRVAAGGINYASNSFEMAFKKRDF